MPKPLIFYTQLKNNNFNLLRLLSAILVLFSHSFPLTGNNADEWLGVATHGFISFGTLAVACFFAISGYLITGSMMNRGKIIDYFLARVLRIFPALIVAVFISTFIIGALVTIYPLKIYFSSTETYRYMYHNMSLWHLSFTLPGVFTYNPYPDAVNGSLWTLPTEFALYIFIGLLGMFSIISSRYTASFMVFFFLILPSFSVSTYTFLKSHIFFPYAVPHVLPLLLCYGLGALFYFWREKILLHWSILLVLTLITWSVHHHHTLFNFVFYFTFTYTVFWLGYHQKIKGHKITQWGDFSYGIYIYAFPVQQTLVYFFHISNPLSLFFSAMPLTSLLAIASWHWIEKPALKLKNQIALRFANTIF